MQNAKNFLFKGLLVTLLATALFAFNRSQDQNVSASYSLSPAGDVNGDGYADVLVSIFTNEFGISKDGNVQLFLGTGNGLGTSPVWNTEGKGGTNFGESIANAGDVNGDGYYDVIIGASRFSNGEENEGGAFVYYGSPQGLASSPAWSMESNQANAFFGVSVSSAGDVNKDGYADVIVGAHYYDNGETNEGRVFIYLGSASGLSKTPFFVAEGEQVNAFFGKSVACAGDVNKDGFSDVIIGAPGYDNGQVNEGRAYLYLGTYMGMTQAPAWTGESNQAEAAFGNSVATGGDVNGDGFSDVIIGANRYDDRMSNVGKIFVYEGSANGFSLYPDWTFTGSKIDGNMGISVAAAGDINGDGYGEIIVGAYGYNPQDPNGDVFVFYGSPSGTINDFIMIDKNKYPGSFIGQSVASAGDTNGDGYADVLAGVIRGTGSPWKLMVIKGSSKGLMQGNTLP
ncbi:MAG TPA: VCBS repeat-containing protein [Chitinophagaceae bacterium]|nr:VCBS repeat-containing protein [Chitinophagaceae bacterium]